MLCLGVPLWPLAARRRCALPGEGFPPPSPPWWPHTLSVRCRSGVSVPCHHPPACRALGACTARSRSLSPSPYSPGRPSPFWPRGRSLLSGSSQRLNRLLDPLAPVSRTRSRAQAWRSRRRRDTCAGSLCCLCPPSCPAVVLAPTPARLVRHPLVSVTGSVRLGFSGGGGGFLPLPAPVRPPPTLLLPWWAPQRFRPPGATLALRGCQFPVAT